MKRDIYKANYLTSSGERYEKPITGASIAALKATILDAAREHTGAGDATKWDIYTEDGERVTGGIVYKSRKGKYSYTSC